MGAGVCLVLNQWVLWFALFFALVCFACLGLFVCLKRVLWFSMFLLITLEFALFGVWGAWGCLILCVGCSGLLGFRLGGAWVCFCAWGAWVFFAFSFLRTGSSGLLVFCLDVHGFALLVAWNVCCLNLFRFI